MRNQDLIKELKQSADLWWATTGEDAKIWASAYDLCIEVLEEAQDRADSLTERNRNARLAKQD